MELVVAALVIGVPAFVVWRFRQIRQAQLSTLRELVDERVRFGMERYVSKSVKEPYEVTATVIDVASGVVRVRDATGAGLSSDQCGAIERQGLPLGELLWVEASAGGRQRFTNGLFAKPS